MFSVFHSNQLESLKILLVHLIKAEPLDHPFTAEKILVQSPGMSQWLKMELAKEFGVAANIEFPLPATFIWDIFTRVLADVPKRSAFNKEAMSWKLMTLLPGLLDLAEFAPLKHYLERDAEPLTLYQLAGKIADIFDGYLVYRPDWIEAWEQNREVAELAGEHPWQPILWRELYQFTIESGHSHYHRGNLYSEFIQAVAEGKVDKTLLPQRLFIFGISALPPRYLDALKALGQQIDIYLMFSNPCQHYWGEIRDEKYLASLRRKTLMIKDGELASLEAESRPDLLHTEQSTGNALLASMGKLGRDNLYLLSQLELDEHEYFLDLPAQDLLTSIQSDIFHLRQQQDDRALLTSQHKTPISPDDQSLTLHSCHSAMREVEVLYDTLLSWFDQDPQLQPRDIIVMVADINAYSGAIQAVFGNAPNDRFIPFSISDRTSDHENPILHAFLQLLALPQSRCLASELLELLETPAILHRFAVDDEEFERARHWVDQAGIRWGLDAHIGDELGFAVNEQNTWQSGIERLLIGYVMSETVDLVELGDNLYSPFKEVQGLGAELAGKLAHFINKIAYYRSQLAQAHPVTEWRTLLAQMLGDFFLVDLEDEVALASVQETLVHLQEQLEDAGYHQDLDSSIVRYYLQSKLSTTRVSQRFLAGQVNFCTLMPMRSIPFKAVCLLGMNDGTYPRTNQSDGFDLMNGRSRIGDRSRRDDERYLFLEALLSARQRFYISYIGQSIKDNSERLASIFVSELLEYCQQNYRLESDAERESDESARRLEQHLIIQHPMVPYSTQAFVGSQPSYAQEWWPVANLAEWQKAMPELALRDCLIEWPRPIMLELSELLKFWNLPVRYFFNQRLKVAFDDRSILVEDDEPFAFDHLQSYQLRHELVQWLLAEGVSQAKDSTATERFKQVKRAQGALANGSFGDLEFEQHVSQTLPLAQIVATLTAEEYDNIEIDLTLQPLDDQTPVYVQGWISGVYSSGLVRYRVGRIRAEDLLGAWIEHLFVALSGASRVTHLIGYEKKSGIEHLVFAPVEDRAEAQSYLSMLVANYFHGLNQPMPYLPKSAMAAIEAGLNKGTWVGDVDEMKKKVQQVFVGGQFISGETENPYIARVWPEADDQLLSQLVDRACQILKPARMAAQEKKDD